MQRFVGASIRGIILLQAGVLALGPGLTGPGLAALLVAVALPAASRLGRRFYGS